MECQNKQMCNARDAINSGLYSLATRHESYITVIDTASVLPNGLRESLPDEVQRLWCRDGVHLSELGSETLARKVFHDLRPLIIGI